MIWTYLLLLLSAVGAGIVNAVAGGGTLLTFPALLTVVSPIVANGTSTVALVPGSAASAWGYRRELGDLRRWLFLLTPPSLLGGALGAFLVSRLPESSFQAAVPWLILTAAILFLLQPLINRLIRVREGTPGKWASAGVVLFQFLVAVYGGYFGAGIGILMLASLGLMGIGNLHRLNALKTLLAFYINGISIVVFVEEGKVNWHYALLMIPAAILGGYGGARLALRFHPGLVRGIVVVIAFALAAHFFYTS
jgi:uncharacterized membrane protein YfcA